jgi:general nucleoside transport system permease protein
MASKTQAYSAKPALTLRVTPREVVPGWLPAAVSVGAVALALAIGAAILALAGGDPLAAYAQIARSAFGDIGVFSDTLVKAIPLMLVGLACALAFRARLWNIGAEGQFFMGAWGASAVVLAPLISPQTSRWIAIPLMMLAGMIAGALWGVIPGLLKARYKVNEIISTLMLNYIAIAWVDFWIFGVWSEGGFQMSAPFPRNAWLPRLADFARQVPAFAGLTTHLGLLFAIVAAGVVWWIVKYSRWGYEIRLVGDNARAAEYAGVPIARQVVLVLMASGALAGLAGMSEISGVVHRLQGAISPGYGFTGIIVAWLAKLNPIAVILVAILFGALILAGREIQPSGIPKMIQGIVLVCLIASDFLLRYRVQLRRAGAGMQNAN